MYHSRPSDVGHNLAASVQRVRTARATLGPAMVADLDQFEAVVRQALLGVAFPAEDLPAVGYAVLVVADALMRRLHDDPAADAREVVAELACVAVGLVDQQTRSLPAVS